MKKTTTPWTAKRVIALIAVFLLLGLYAAAFITALLDGELAARMFRFCLGMTIAVPIFAWIAIWAVGVLTNRHTMASMDLLHSNEDARREMEDALARETGGDAESGA